MRYLFFLLVPLALVAAVPDLPSAPADKKPPADSFKQVPRATLDVSAGQVGENKDGFLTIDHPEVRATQRAKSARAARLVFTFHGPTKQESKLASGAVARQIGLKLRAKNTCNLLYVMWKLDDKEQVAVSVKRNPGKATHQECGANGYVSIAPAFKERPERFPSAKDGKPHTLEAEVTKPDAAAFELVVKADGKVVWQGKIEAKLLDDIDGPAGFRSDNCAFTFKLYSLEGSDVKFGAWKLEKGKDRYYCEYRYPARNNPAQSLVQIVIWYPNDAQRKGYYYFANKSNQVWGRCVCPKNPTYDPNTMQWSKFENNAWTDLPAGTCPAPKDGDPARAAIDRIPDLPE